MDVTALQDFGARYTTAWCSQNAASVAAFYAEDGALTINGGAPAVGRAAITASAQGFMTAFPDMVVAMDGVSLDGDRAVYRWTLTGSNTGPGGTGRTVRISGHEEWTFGRDGLIATSRGHFDEAEYHRQLGRDASRRAAGGHDMSEHEPRDVGNHAARNGPRVLGPLEGDILGAVTAVRDRFMIEAARSGGGFALVEHLMPPRTLAAPLHRHSREDEYSYVLEGHVGGHFDGVEVFGGAGSLIVKPRGEWHTFWNAGDVPARILEIISPAGFEQAFREMHALGDALDPAAMAGIGARYGVDVDFERTGPIIERHGLRF